MISEFIGENLLSEKIDSDSNLNILKNRSLATSNLLAIGAEYYQNDRLMSWSKNIKYCGSFLGYAETIDGLKLRSANFCRCRICPMCSARMARKWYGKSSQAIENFDIFSNYQILFLSLTIKNCLLENLKKTIDHLSYSFVNLMGANRFNYLKGNKPLGYIRSLETTAKYNLYAHPHYHALIAMPDNYFQNYLTMYDWREAWAKSLNIDYLPSVHIKKVRHQDVFLELLKYELKPDDYKNDWRWLCQFALQISGSRKIALGGIFRQRFRFLEYIPDLIFDNDDIFKLRSSKKMIKFEFNHKFKQYTEVG